MKYLESLMRKSLDFMTVQKMVRALLLSLLALPILGATPSFAKGASASPDPSCFRRLSTNWTDLITGDYDEFLNGRNRTRGGVKDELSPGNNRDYEQRLGRRRASADGHVYWLLQLGWREVNDPNLGKLIVPPKDGPALIKRIQDLLMKRGQEARVPLESIMQVGLLFGRELERQDDAAFRVFSDLRAGRPFVDPMFSAAEFPDHTSAGSSGRIPHRTWGEMMGAKVLPISFKFLHHDMAHITEYLEFPWLMHYDSEFYRLMSQLPDPNAWAEGTEVFARVEIAREWFSTVNLSKSAELTRLLPPLIAEKTELVTSRQMDLQWSRQTRREKYNQVTAIADADPSLFVRLGGGLRDPLSFEKPMELRWSISKAAPVPLRIQEILVEPITKLFLYDREMDTRELTLQGRVFIIKSLLRYLLKLEPANFERNVNGVKTKFSLSAEEVRSKLEPVLFNQVLQFQIMVHSDLVLGMSPELFIREAMQPKVSRVGPLFKYLSTFSFPGSQYYSKFLSPRVTVP